MSTRTSLEPRDPQAGGISILVALMLLVLLTIATLGMNRNAMRDIVSSGFSRQGANAASTANSGIEWALYWMTGTNGTSCTASAKAMLATQTTLLQNSKYWGQPMDIITGTAYSPGGTLQGDLKWSNQNGTGSAVQGFTIGVTYMGHLPPTNTSQGVSQGQYDPATGTNNQGDYFWAVRSDAQVIQGPVTFTQAQEAWISNPVQ
jgi:hypothetical protein